MATIQLLDTETINKIAAGEVVDRPSSVVKELVENAIDAKATAITVEIKDGGTSLIRITDNGGGIPKEDIPTAFLRHSTSKIRSATDLLSISSLGFRGEALSSITAVAQVELITKTPNALLGVRYLIDGGQEKLMEEIGCPSGTTFLIRNLFFNTPARKKFLKTNTTEAGYISDLMSRLALSHPEISFKYTVNNQIKLHTMGNHHLKDIIYNVYGRDVTANLLPVNYQSDAIKVEGFIGKPLISRGNRSFENYFINGRYIKSNIITKAIEEAYKTFIMIHKYPFTALHLTIPSDDIDVNVHPSKMEIRFNNNEEIYRIIYQVVRQALEGRELIPKVSADTVREERAKLQAERKAEHNRLKDKKYIPEPFENRRRETLYKAAEAEKTIPPASQPKSAGTQAPQPKPVTTQRPKPQPVSSATSEPKPVNTQISKPQQPMPSATSEPKPVNTQQPEIESKEKPVDTKPEQLSLFDDKLLSRAARTRHKLIGQIFDTYWLVEYDNQLFIIDQHAAHEKVKYEQLVKAYKNKKPVSQYLQPPIIISVTPKEQDILHAYDEYFKAFGFEIEPFGGKEYAVRAVPLDLYGFGEKELVTHMLDALTAENYTEKEDIIINHLAVSACKAAVKGQNKLSFKEADALIDLLLQAENPYTCPHGRPTIISLSQYDLERKFKRIQD